MISKKKMIIFILTAVLINVVIYLFSYLIPVIEEVDIQLLLFLNPDTYIPIIDELMVMITDFSMIVFPITYIIWILGFLVLKKDPSKQEGISNVFKLIGIILAIGVVTGYFWAGYDLPFVLVILGVVLFTTFWILGNKIKKGDIDSMEKYVQLFGIILIAAILTNAISEMLIKEIVGRPRPLNPLNEAWNSALLVRPDARSAHGYSYASGHSSAMFMMLTPVMFEVKDKKKKVLCFLFAATHSFTRVYLVAHFPYCALWGSLQGFAFAVLAYKTFRAKKSI